MKKNIIEILKMNRYLFFSSILFFIGLAYFFRGKTGNKQFFLKSEKSVCDTTEIPKYSLFDLANLLNNHINNIADSSNIILLITDIQGYKSKISYNKAKNIFLNEAETESSFSNLTLIDMRTPPR